MSEKKQKYFCRLVNSKNYQDQIIKRYTESVKKRKSSESPYSDLYNQMFAINENYGIIMQDLSTNLMYACYIHKKKQISFSWKDVENPKISYGSDNFPEYVKRIINAYFVNMSGNL